MIENLSDREYFPSEVTFQQDLDYVMNKSVYACSFKSSRDNSLLYGESQEYFIEKYEQDKQKARGVEIGVLLVGVIIMGIVLYFFEDSMGEAGSIVFIITGLVIVGLVGAFLKPQGVSAFTLKIDNFNCSSYQLRRLSDDKLCIICGANFDEENKVLDDNFISEDEPTFSDLIILEDVESIEEIKQGIIISATTIIRKYQPDKPYNKYTEMDEHMRMNIFIQKGVYSEKNAGKYR